MAYRQDVIAALDLMATGKFRMGSQVATLSGNKTIVDGEGPILAYDCGGSTRTITLPARAVTNDGQVLILINLSTDAEVFTIKNSAATTLLSAPSGSVAFAIATGTVEAPGTREWKVVQLGGDDLAIADDLTVTGDLAVTGISTLTGSVLASAGGKFGANTTTGISFYGTTTITQRAGTNQATSLAITNSVGTAAGALILEMANTLIAVGLMKGAA